VPTPCGCPPRKSRAARPRRRRDLKRNGLRGRPALDHCPALDRFQLCSRLHAPSKIDRNRSANACNSRSLRLVLVRRQCCSDRASRVSEERLICPCSDSACALTFLHLRDHLALNPAIIRDRITPPENFSGHFVTTEHRSSQVVRRLAPAQQVRSITSTPPVNPRHAPASPRKRSPPRRTHRRHLPSLPREFASCNRAPAQLFLAFVSPSESFSVSMLRVRPLYSGLRHRPLFHYMQALFPSLGIPPRGPRSATSIPVSSPAPRPPRQIAHPSFHIIALDVPASGSRSFRMKREQRRLPARVRADQRHALP